MKAIILPYCCDQNEPSRPLNKIVDLPTNVKKRDAMLIKLFRETFEVDDEDAPIIRKGTRDDYGDLIVSHPFDVFLYVTFIKD